MLVDSPADTTNSGVLSVSLLIHAGIGTALTAVGMAGAYSVTPLLADQTPTEIAVIVAISGVVGAGGKWAADQVVKWRKDTHEAKAADRQMRSMEKSAEIKHLEGLLDRETTERRQLQTEMAEERRQHQAEMAEERRTHQGEVNDLRRQLTRIEIKANRSEVWIRHQEVLFRNHKIDFVPWSDGDDDSDEIHLHGPDGRTDE